jgi:hypothetical protein
MASEEEEIPPRLSELVDRIMRPSHSLDHIFDPANVDSDPHFLLCEVISSSLGIPCVSRLSLRLIYETALGEAFDDDVIRRFFDGEG